MVLKPFSFVLIFCFLVPVCRAVCTVEPKEYCLGWDANRLPSGETSSRKLADLRRHFSGCEVIDGSISIALSDPGDIFEQTDFDFLCHLKEITGLLRLINVTTTNLTLPNLVLIRGRQLTGGGHSLEIASSHINSLFGNLREISKGHVSIHDSSWCGYKTVNWEDILEDGQLVTSEQNELLKPNEDCKDVECAGCGEDNYCWGPTAEDCQTLNKVGKKTPNACKQAQKRSYDDGIGCCDDSCVAGCTGGRSVDCFACKMVNSEGVCDDFCPDDEKFVTVNDTVMRNPNFLVQAGDFCLKQCPSGLFEKGRLCVADCGDGYAVENGRCEQCIGSCLNGEECIGYGPNAAVEGPGDGVLQNFIDKECTIVNGNIRFNSKTTSALNNGGLTIEHLKRFEHIQVIRGVLSLQGWNSSLPPLDFFRNVEYIGSEYFSLTTISTPGSSTALIVANNGDTCRIDLSNLRQIRVGNVAFARNEDLCYIGDFQTELSSTYLANPEMQNVTKQMEPYESVENCVNKTCHPECVEERRCWGPNDTNCVLCTNYRYEQEWKCVPDCSLDNDTYQDDTLTSRTYRYCASCDEECIGCTGPGPFLCKQCRNFEINFSNGSRKCVPSCPVGYYEDGTPVCKPCHPLCVGGCSGPGGFVGEGGCEECIFVTFNETEEEILDLDDASSVMNQCVDKCSLTMYQTRLMDAVGEVDKNNRVCFQCDKQCDACSGPKSTDCCKPEDGNCISIGAQVNTLDAVSPWPILGAVLGVLSGLVLLALLLILAFFLYRKRRGSVVKYGDEEVIGVTNEMYGTLDDIMEQVLPVPRVQPNLSKIVITPVDSLQFEEKLGSGAFGTVHKGLWQPPGEGFQYTVAIKVLNDDTPSNATQELLDEGVAMASMDHPYIVRLYAMCMGENLMLVTQFLPMGSLLHFLRKYKDELNAYHLLTYGQQIAEGMAYLEEQRMVHRDLAARNVLVQTSSKVKIADFGLSKCLEVGESGYKAGKGKVPVRWLAPESLRKREFSHKSDVWAYGVTMWEVLTFGAKPYGKRKAQEVLSAIERGERLPQPATSSIELYATLLKCWLLNPDSRPSFNVLSDTFRPWCSDPLRYVSTTRDGALVSYTDLPTNEAEEEECDYECIDVLLKSQDPSTNSTVLRNSHSVEDVEDDYHMLADTAQGYEDPSGVSNGEIGRWIHDTQDQPPEYNEIDEINFNDDDDHDGDDGYHMLPEAINGYEDPIVTDGKTQDDNDSYHMLSEAINGYEDPVVVGEKSEDDDGYLVVSDDDDEDPNGYVEIDEDENGKETLVPKSSIYRDEEANDTVLFNPNTEYV